MILELDYRIDEALRASANGDQHAFADVCEWYSHRLMAYCRSRLRFEDLRVGYQDDLLNEVLAAFWREIIKCPDANELTSQQAWCIVRRIAKSLACDHYRADYCRKRRPAEGIRNFDLEHHSPPFDDDGILDLEIKEELHRFLNRLCDRDHKLLEMRRGGVNIDTIAREMNVGSSTLYNRLRDLELAFNDWHDKP